MPTFSHGKNTKVLINTAEFTSYFKEYAVNNSMDVAETSAFGSGTKTYVQGLSGATCSLSGMFDGSANAVDQELAAAIGSASTTKVTIAPTGSFAIGARVLAGTAWQSSYNVTGSLSDIVACSAEFTGTYGFRSGVSLHNNAAGESASTNSAGVDGLAVSSNGALAILHLTANTRDAGSIVVAVKAGADNITFGTTLGTFTSVAGLATSTQAIEIPAGTSIPRYVRAESTVTGGTTGSYTYTVSFVRF